LEGLHSHTPRYEKIKYLKRFFKTVFYFRCTVCIIKFEFQCNIQVLCLPHSFEIHLDGGRFVECGMKSFRAHNVLGVHPRAIIYRVETAQLAGQQEVGVGGRPLAVGVVGRLDHRTRHARGAAVAESRHLRETEGAFRGEMTTRKSFLFLAAANFSRGRRRTQKAADS